MTGCTSNESPQDTIPFEKYHSNGKPSIVGQKVKSTGKAIGEWKYYDNNGRLKESGFFETEKNMENGIDTIRVEKLSLHLITQMVKTSEL